MITAARHAAIANAATEFAASVTCPRFAARCVREEADALIDQMNRRAKGWDKGIFRSDDVTCWMSIEERTAHSVATAFALSAKFAR